MDSRSPRFLFYFLKVGCGACLGVDTDHISPFIILCKVFKPTTFLAGRSARVIDGFNWSDDTKEDESLEEQKFLQVFEEVYRFSLLSELCKYVLH